MAQRVVVVNQRVPSNRLKLFERGGIVDGTQSAVNTVLVHTDHDFAIGDKFLICPDRVTVWMERVFTVTNVAGGNITFSGDPWSFINGVYLLNLGADTGGILMPGNYYTLPNLDGSTVYPYSDPTLSDRFTNDEVPLDPGIGWAFWTDNDLYWAVAIRSGRPVAIYPDVGGTASGGGGAGVTRGGAFPGTPTEGDFHVYVQGAGQPDITYQYIKKGDDAFAWVEVVRAPA